MALLMLLFLVLFFGGAFCNTAHQRHVNSGCDFHRDQDLFRRVKMLEEVLQMERQKRIRQMAADNEVDLGEDLWLFHTFVVVENGVPSIPDSILIFLTFLSFQNFCIFHPWFWGYVLSKLMFSPIFAMKNQVFFPFFCQVLPGFMTPRRSRSSQLPSFQDLSELLLARRAMMSSRMWLKPNCTGTIDMEHCDCWECWDGDGSKARNMRKIMRLGRSHVFLFFICFLLFFIAVILIWPIPKHRKIFTLAMACRSNKSPIDAEKIAAALVSLFSFCFTNVRWLTFLVCFMMFFHLHFWACHWSRFYVSGHFFCAERILCRAGYIAVLIDSLPGKNDTTNMVVSSHFDPDFLLRLWLDQFFGLHR